MTQPNSPQPISSTTRSIVLAFIFVCVFLIGIFVGYHIPALVTYPETTPATAVDPKLPDHIIESNSIDTITNYIQPDEHTKDTLVVFDIDNTLIAPTGDLGGDAWFSFMFNEYLKRGYSVHDAVEQIHPAYVAIQETIVFKTVEPDTASFIKTLEKDVSVMALTARSFRLIDHTIELLENLDIRFTPLADDLHILESNGIRPAHYQHGIIFSGNNDKGKMLVTFFDKFNYHPKKVIFIDDKLNYLISVDRALSARNIPFVGIRYSAMDQRVKEFNPAAVMVDILKHPAAAEKFDPQLTEAY